MHTIETLIRELTEADPSLKGRETSLRQLLGELLAGRPEVSLDPAFRASLKLQLAKMGPPARPTLVRRYRPGLYYGIGTAALVVLLMFIVRPEQSGPPVQVAFKATDDASAPTNVAAPEAADSITMTATRQASSTMQLTSDAFEEGQAIPVQYTCDGNSLTPPLAWADIPEEAQSLALVIHDPDAPREGGFTHLVVYDIPARSSTPDGTAGANGTGKTGYVGPCPPTGTHHYVFTLYALDTVLGLKEGTDRAGFLSASEGHVLSTVELIGTYRKQ